MTGKTSNTVLNIAAGAVLGLALTSAPLSAATDHPIKPDSKDPVMQAAADGAVHITPHRAIYKVSLASIKNGGSVSDIEGRMYYSWADDCDNWNIEQKMQVRYYYGEGDVSTSKSSLISREAKDGSSYVFRARRITDDDPEEVVRGAAHLKKDSVGGSFGEANAIGATEKKFQFSAATTFPIHHTLEVLAKAKAGTKFFGTNVFDGSDEKALNEITSFIGPAVEPAMIEKASTNAASVLDSNPLLKVRGWPVRMAFFAPDSSPQGSPDYEMDVLLLDNGVIKTMTVDYGDFAMKAELINVEALPASKCKAPAIASAE